MWIWMLGLAVAGPMTSEEIEAMRKRSEEIEAMRRRAESIEVVHHTERQGKVRIVLAGREGDAVRVDGWVLGTIPLETELVEGLHTLKVEGEAGVVEVKTNIVVADEIVEIDLAAVQPAAIEAPKMLSVQGDNPQLRLDRIEQTNADTAEVTGTLPASTVLAEE